MVLLRALLSILLVAPLLVTPGCGDAPLEAATDTIDPDILDPDALPPVDTAGDDTTAAADTSPPDTTPQVVLPDAAAPSDTTAPVGDASTEPLGGERPAAVYLPADYSPSDPRPLVILLHGYSATGALQDIYLRFHERATEHGFIAIVPEGTRNLTGIQFWNASPAWCCDFMGSGVDDAAYVLDLVAEARSRFAVEADRVYLLGHSNGGFMAYKMACEHADVFAGVVSIAGSSVRDADDCQPASPLTVVQVHGTLDAVIAYLGVPFQFPGAETVVDRWVAWNGCDEDPLSSVYYNYDSAVFGDETTRKVWDGCDGGVLVSLWRMFGSTHVPVFNDEFLPDVFDFLLSH